MPGNSLLDWNWKDSSFEKYNYYSTSFLSFFLICAHFLITLGILNNSPHTSSLDLEGQKRKKVKPTSDHKNCELILNIIIFQCRYPASTRLRTNGSTGFRRCARFFFLLIRMDGAEPRLFRCPLLLCIYNIYEIVYIHIFPRCTLFNIQKVYSNFG